jgi:hypothetical protein
MGDAHYIRGYTQQPPQPKTAKQVLIERARAFLKARNITFAERNHGTVFLLEGPNGKISYWPTTSKWADHAEGDEGEGINSLVKHYDKVREQRFHLEEPDVQPNDDDTEAPW